MNFIRIVVKKARELVVNILSIVKKTISTMLILGYLLIFIWSVVATLTGWYFAEIEESVKGFIVLCLCLGIILHIGENSKRSDDIAGESNKEDDTGLREDT